MSYIKQTYWQSKATGILNENEIKKLKEFSNSINIKDTQMDLLYEAFYRAKDSILKSKIDFENMGEPKKTQLLEVIAYIWYLEGYSQGKKEVSPILESFKKDDSIDSLLLTISNNRTKDKVEQMLKNNEDRYVLLAKERITQEVPTFLEGHIPKEQGVSEEIQTILEQNISNEFIQIDTDATLSVSNNSIATASMIVDTDTVRYFLETTNISFDNWVKKEYEKFNAQEYGLSLKCFKQAMTTYLNGIKSGDILRPELLTIIDYSLPSTQKRMFILDMENKKIDEVLHVSHGAKPSERSKIASFSNIYGSNKSSMGFAVTGWTQNSSTVGYSLIIEGLESYNSNMKRRGIVMHGAQYVTNTRAGCSQGCPAINDADSKRIIDKIKGGTGIFFYSGQESYAKNSTYLNEQNAQYTLRNLTEIKIASTQKTEKDKKS